jgi:hypothetical protein
VHALLLDLYTLTVTCPLCKWFILHTFMLYWKTPFYFGGNSIYNKKVFLQQKRIIRTITGLSSRTPCQISFQRSELLALCSQHVLSLKKFLSQNLESYTFNSTIHGFNTRNNLQLHKLSTTLTMHQKGA